MTESKLTGGWRRAGMALGLLAAASIVIEASSFGVLRLLALRARTVPKPEASLPVYKEAHVRFIEGGFESYPYGLWRQRPFKGELANNDERGERRTLNSDCNAGASTIFVSGGSTLWDQGSPDRQWIDALATITRPLLAGAKANHLHDLSDLYSASLRTDLCHLVPEANRLIAGTVYDVINGSVPVKLKR